MWLLGDSFLRSTSKSEGSRIGQRQSWTVIQSSQGLPWPPWEPCNQCGPSELSWTEARGFSLCTSNWPVIEYGVLPGKGGVTLSYPELREVPGERVCWELSARGMSPFDLKEGRNLSRTPYQALKTSSSKILWSQPQLQGDLWRKEWTFYSLQLGMTSDTSE